MKGDNPTRAQKEYWDRLASVVGCIACRKIHGPHEPGPVSIHHIEGRTRKYTASNGEKRNSAHWYVLPLCAGHHQKGYGPDPKMLAIHGDKKRFELEIGQEETLWLECFKVMDWVPTGIKEWLGCDYV